MGYWCRICNKTKANERFSGKGRKRHICKACSQKPKSEIEEIDQMDEICGYMNQSNISQKNITRLEKLVNSQNSEISKLAIVVLEVAYVKPYKRKRLGFLAKENRELLLKVKELGYYL